MMSEKTMETRRIVTTHDANGNAVLLSDGPSSNIGVRSSGIKSTLLWTTNSMPVSYSNTDRANVKIGTGPPPGATILRVVEFPPAERTHSEADSPSVLAEMGIPPPGGERRPPRHPHMHATDSVDYAIVLEGEIDMLLDEGEVHVKAGDILIQQGTNHAWVNRGDRTCKIAFVLIDATGSPLIPTD
jgi:mannose-6-phosphate isomerase-like protein (cupin superfamily)